MKDFATNFDPKKAQAVYGSRVICRTPARNTQSIAGVTRSHQPLEPGPHASQKDAWRDLFGTARAAAQKRSADHLTSTAINPKRSCAELRTLFEHNYLQDQKLQVANILRNNARREHLRDLQDDSGLVDHGTSVGVDLCGSKLDPRA